MLIYVGGYGEKSLSLCEFDPDLGKAGVIESYEIENASYICMSEDKKILYAVIEKPMYKNQTGGGVMCFRIGADGRLELINEVFTRGEDPCHISIDVSKGMLYTANYTDGSITFFELNSDGSIGQFIKKINNEAHGNASGVIKDRQEKPHAHFASTWSERVWVCDLGMDKVLNYDNKGELVGEIILKPGSGPRHLVFHPNRQLAYLVCELSAEIAALNQKGEVIGYTYTLAERNINNTSAAIRISPCGNYILISNRGADCLSVLRITEDGDIPELMGMYSTEGHCPRDFVFNDLGNIIACANQESDEVCFFWWNEKKCLLSEKIKGINIQKPTCVLFL